MNSEKIDLADLPGLDVPTGIFGSTIDGMVYNDAVVSILIYVFETGVV